jgi:hypothetical protein
MKTIVHIVGALILAGAINPAQADEIAVPDPGLNTAIREAVQKPVGPLTSQDLLSLTNLTARLRSIANTEGLQAAANLKTPSRHKLPGRSLAFAARDVGPEKPLRIHVFCSLDNILFAQSPTTA